MKIQTSRQFFARLASRRAARLFRAVTLLTFGAITTTQAATLSWDGGIQTINGASDGGSGTWDNTTTLNWDNGTAEIAWPGAGNSAVFGGTGGTVTLGTAITADSVAFNVDGYTVNAGTLGLTLSGLNGTGTNSLIYAGAGTTTISGALTITGSATGNTELFTAASGATLSLTGTITQTNTANTSLSINGPGTVNYSGTAFTPGKFNVIGGATFNTSGTMTIAVGTYTGVSDTVAGTTWNVNTGSTITGTGTTLFIGGGTGNSGAMVVNGGTATFNTVNIGNSFSDTTDTNAVGTLTINGGTFSSSSTTSIKLGGGLGTGTINLNGGTFNIGGNVTKGLVTSGNTGGSATLNFNGGTVRPTAAATIGGLDTANVRNGGAIFTTNGQTLTVTQALLHSTINGDNATDGGLTKLGGGTLILSGANTYTGATIVGVAGGSGSAGTLTVNGSAGTINTSSSYSVYGSGSQLSLDYTTGASVDRLKNAGSLTLNLGGEVLFTGNTTSNTAETFGTLTLGAGNGIITISQGAGASATLTSTGFSRGSTFGTALLRGSNVGAGTGVTSDTSLQLNSTSGLTLIGTTTSNTGNATGTVKNLVIVPYLLGDTSSGNNGKNFVTYDTTSGFRPLVATNEQSLIASGSTNDNVKTAAGTNTVSAGAKVFNSLLVGAGTATTPATTAATVTGAGGTSDSLTLTSGALANVATGASGTGTISGFSSIIFGMTGANEAVITNANASSAAFTISSPIDTFATNGALTKTGAGPVILTAANLYTGVTTINQGTLQIGNGTSGSLATNSGAVTINPGTTLSLVQPTGSTFANAIVNNGTLSITNAGAQTLSGNISGVSGITQATAATTLTLSGTNTYTGATSVSAGTLSLSGSLSGTNISTSGTGIFSETAAGAISGAGSFTQGSSGTSILAGTNTYTGATSVSAGTLSLSGSLSGTNISTSGTGTFSETAAGAISGASSFTQGSSVTTILSSANNTYSGATTVTTTLAGIGSHAFGNTSGINIGAAGVLSLRGDTSTTFSTATGSTPYTVIPTASGSTIDVTSATVGVTTAKTMTIGPIASLNPSVNSVINFTGSNNTSLSVGAVSKVATSVATATTFANSITGGGILTVASYTGANTLGGESLRFNGTGTTVVTGAITPSATGLSILFNGAGTLRLNGQSTFAGVPGGTSTIDGVTYLNGVVSTTAGATLQIGASSNAGFTSGPLGLATVVVGGGNTTMAVGGAQSVGNQFVTNNSAATFGGTGSSDLTINGLFVNGGTNNLFVTNNSSTLTLAGGVQLRNTAGQDRILNLNGSGNIVISGNIVNNGSGSGAGGILYDGTGTLTLSGTNSYSSTTTANRGNLVLDYTTNNTNKISTLTSALVVGGGAVSIIGNATAATSQNLGNGLTVNAGGSSIGVISNSTGGATLNLGAITRNVGGTVEFNTTANAGTAAITTTTANANGILGGYATFGKNDWATGTNATPFTVAAYTGYTVIDTVSGINTTSAPAASNLSDDNNGYDGTTTSGFTVNSLRFNASGANSVINQSGNIILTSGGILVTANSSSANFQKIFGGNITSGGADLIVQENGTGSGRLQIGSTIYGAIGLTKSGVGTLELSNSDATYTGVTTVNGGNLILTAGTTATTKVTVNPSGTVMLSGDDRINNNATVTLNGGTINTGGFKEGNATGTAAATTGLGALTLSSSSTLDFGLNHTGSSVLAFANSSTTTWSGTLTLADFTAGTDYLNFASSTGLTATQLAAITYSSLSGSTLTTYIGSGLDTFGDVTFTTSSITTVPEPTTVFGGVFMVAVLGWSLRGRFTRRVA